jgi:Ca2+/Na+ antiporter
MLSGFGICVEIVVFLLVFHLMQEVNIHFSRPALESMYIRKGGKSESFGYILHSVGIILPEILVTCGTVAHLSPRLSSTLSLRAFIGSGLVTHLLLPSIFIARSIRGIPLYNCVRDGIAYCFGLCLVWMVLLDNVISTMDGVFLLFSFIFYLGIVWRTHHHEQRQRDIRRETRLLMRLAPLQVSLGEESLKLNTTDIEELDVVEPVVSPQSVTTRILSLICVKAEPGTDSEQKCLLSLLNALGLEISLAYVLALICERWIGSVTDLSVWSSIVTMIIFPVLTHAHHIHKSFVSSDPTFLSALWSSRCISLSLGLGLPWLVSNLIGRTVRPVDVSGLRSELAVCLLSTVVGVLAVMTIKKSRTVLFMYPSALVGIFVLPFIVGSSR